MVGPGVGGVVAVAELMVMLVVEILTGIEGVFLNVAVLYLLPRSIRRGFAVGGGGSPGLDGHDAGRRMVNIDVWGERDLVPRSKCAGASVGPGLIQSPGEPRRTCMVEYGGKKEEGGELEKRRMAKTAWILGGSGSVS